MKAESRNGRASAVANAAMADEESGGPGAEAGGNHCPTLERGAAGARRHPVCSPGQQEAFVRLGETRMDADGHGSFFLVRMASKG